MPLRKNEIRTLAAVTALLGLWAASSSAAPEKAWFKGNLHTHTVNSDGDSTPSEVTAWYREHKYQFLILTDHNYLTTVEGLNAVHGAKDKFMLIPGEEPRMESCRYTSMLWDWNRW